jgi:hypothetical protein
MNIKQSVTPEVIYQLSTKLFEFGRGRLFSPEVRAELRMAAHTFRQLLFEGTIMKEIELTSEGERFIYAPGDLTMPMPPADANSFMVEMTGEQVESLRNLIEIALGIDPVDSDNAATLGGIMSALAVSVTKRAWLKQAGNMSDTNGDN